MYIKKKPEEIDRAPSVWHLRLYKCLKYHSQQTVNHIILLIYVFTSKFHLKQGKLPEMVSVSFFLWIWKASDSAS